MCLKTPRIQGLDFLRAVAVLSVLFDHAGYGLLVDGVELFFVISGFLITLLLLLELEVSGDINLIAFYRRRIARLLPAFYVYLAAGLLTLLVRGKPIPWDAVISGIFYVLNYYQGLTGAQNHFLSHCWSLAVEEQFYLLWPFALLFLTGRRLRLDLTLIVIVSFVVVLRPLLFLGFHVSEAYVYRALETRTDQLMIGCLLAVLLRRSSIRQFFERLPLWVLAATVLLIVISSQWHDCATYKFSIGFAFEPILMALMIPLVITCAQGSGWLAKLFNWRFTALVGEASYGMYLVHPLILHSTQGLVLRLTHSMGIATIIAILAIACIAIASLWLFENPMRRALQPARRVTAT